MSEIIMLPIEQLIVTGTNARKDHIADRAMIASLKSQGLLYPLLVEGLEDGKFDVVDGARRLTCIIDGVASGELDAGVWRSIPCLKGNGDGRALGLEQSLHANLHMAMHPLDECEAILTLSKMGEMGDDIALRFGQDVRWLDQRVKLAELCDEVKDMFRAGDISLASAMAFTLGDHAKQQAFLKQHKKEGFVTSMIGPAMTDRWVNARHTNFQLDQYTGPRNSDLFGEDIWLLDRKMVAELQDEWAQGEIAGLQARGYDKVEVLKADDWQTLQSHVEVTGRIGKDDRGRLKCFLKADANGHIKVYENMAPRKAVDDKGKIKPKVHQADTTGPENIKPLLCTELTVAQQEIVNALAASDLYARIEEGDERLAKFMVIDRHLGEGFWTGFSGSYGMSAPLRRWAKLNTDYPAEQLILAAEAEAVSHIDLHKINYEKFCAMSESGQEQLFLKACASLVMAPYGQQDLKGHTAELAGRDWLVPGSDFFKRYRTDQLIDYRKRSGDREAGKTSKNKSAHVADCVVAATTPGAFKLGLYPKKIQIPAAGKKRKGGLPDET